MTRISPHFTLDELLRSDYALRHGLPNTPSDLHVVGNLHVLASGLERCRMVLKQPLMITSGYRSPAVNKGIGGSPRSAHLRGLAADFRVPGMSPRDVCLALQAHPEVGFDQLIYEGQWTHVAFPDSTAPAGVVLSAIFQPGRPVSYAKGIL